MNNGRILRIVLIFFIFLFLAWISFFDQSLQLRFKNITLIGLCIFCLLSFLYKGKIKLSKLDIALFIYLSAVTLSVPFSEDKLAALDWYRIYILPIPFVYFIAKNLGRDFKFPITIGFVVFSSCIVLFGISELILRKNIIYEFWVTNMYYPRYIRRSLRIMSTLAHPTVFGTYLLGCLPFSFFLASEIKNKYRGLVVLYMVTAIAGIIFSFSRGILLGLFVLSSSYFYFIKRVRYLKFLIAGLFILILISSYIKLPDLISKSGLRRFCLENLTTHWWERKTEPLHITSKIIKQYPLSGIGLNHYRLKFDQYKTDKFNQREEQIKKSGYDPMEWKIPDNMYLSILAETGLLGFISFISFLFLLFNKSLNYFNRVNDLTKKRFLIVCFCSIIGLLITMNCYDMLYWINPLLLFWFLVGILGSIES